MMAIRSIVLSALTATAAWPAAAVAQERQPENRPRIFINGPEAVRDRVRLITQRRARLGVTVDLRASANDSIGATIESVTPSGPAAKAGLKSGDIITKLNGKVLITTSGEKPNMEESLPGLRLAEIAAQLKPNDTVSVEYRREGVRKTTSLVTGNEPVMTFEGFPGMGMEGEGGHYIVALPRVNIQRRPGGRAGNVEIGPGMAEFSYAFGGPLMDLELAPLNPDLSPYFGTTEGVLVINVPKESTLGLKGGDVIQSVDGRKVTSPPSLLRILRSYDPGDSFKLEIMRNKSRMTVTGKLGKAGEN